MEGALADFSKAVGLDTRYEDVNALFRDERFTKDRRSALTPEQIRKLPWVPPTFRPLERNMLDLDPPLGQQRVRLRDQFAVDSGIRLKRTPKPISIR